MLPGLNTSTGFTTSRPEEPTGDDDDGDDGAAECAIDGDGGEGEWSD